MKERIKKWWSDFKTFDWKMYLALCLLALVPAIYQTIVTGLITTKTNPGSLDIVGQMEWFDLIDETICAFLIIPMYSVLSKAKKTESFNKIVFITASTVAIAKVEERRIGGQTEVEEFGEIEVFQARVG